MHILRNGSGIAKPIVHGLFGNRLSIINNGVVQSGQQWGNDHSPEIDPLIANRVTVIKGSNALEYVGGNLGSLILVEPQNIQPEPHVHGRIGYSFVSNGRGHNFNTQVQQYRDAFAWRLNGTYKNFGDRQTPDYFLNNTGVEESNFSLQLEKMLGNNIFLEFYLSTFNTQLGVLRGSHIGNLTDLQDALARDVPFFTEDVFSRELESPRQKVNHHLTKIAGKIILDNSKFIEFILSGQLNKRKEFDVRRGGRSNIPALSLTQYTYSSDLKYLKEYASGWLIKIGNQIIYTDNVNNPETDIFPLIPDYISFKTGSFVTMDRTNNTSSINVGVRYDYERQNVVAFANTFPRSLLRFNNNFHNASGRIGYNLNITSKQSLGISAGFAMRNPGINELYSNGLHQGVSGIEEGNPNLKIEKGFKTTINYKYQPGSRLSLESTLYYQLFNNYIFLAPQEDFRLTIRGAFPVFKYAQTNSRILGLDINSQFSITQSIIGKIKYSYIHGTNTTDNLPLINIPSANLYSSLTFRPSTSLRMNKFSLENQEIQINYRYVFKQNNLLDGQDFVNPPDAYGLLGIQMNTNVLFPHYRLRLTLRADNLLNIDFRNLLNRQRYFADDLGRSVVVGLNMKF